MTRQEYKQKLMRKIIFTHKIKDKDIIKELKNASFEDTTLLHIQMRPLPRTLKQHNSQFIWIKRHCDYAIRYKRECSNKLTNLKNEYSKFIKENKIKNTNDFTPEQYTKYRLLLELISLEEQNLETAKDSIIDLNGKLEYICDYYDRINLPLSEFASLCGINYVSAKLNIKDETDDTEDHKYWNYLFNGIEDSREDTGWKSNRNGIPIFHLTTQNFMIMMERNKELKDKVDDYVMHTMGMAKGAMKFKTDDEGNQILEKYYHPLKVIK